MCINICWSITFLFSIHFQPDTKSIDLRDISLSLLASQSLIYRTQYYIMPKEWRIFRRDVWPKNANLPIQASKGHTPLLSEIGLRGIREEVLANEFWRCNSRYRFSKGCKNERGGVTEDKGRRNKEVRKRRHLSPARREASISRTQNLPGMHSLSSSETAGSEIRARHIKCCKPRITA